MRISDWSSDVCSSDLLARFAGDFALSFLNADQRFALTDLVELSQLGTGLMLIRRDVVETLGARHPELAFRTDARDRQGTGVREEVHALFLPEIDRGSGLMLSADYAFRSEERRVGKECVRTCRSRWWPYH